MSNSNNLTRREQQVVDVIIKIGEGTVQDVTDKLMDGPSYSAIRAVLSRLVSKGILKFEENGPKYLYSVAGGAKKAKQNALTKLVDTFFDGSHLHTINALLGISANKLSKEELKELAQAIAEAAEKEND